jgi:hypothetical protein
LLLSVFIGRGDTLVAIIHGESGAALSLPALGPPLTSPVETKKRASTLVKLSHSKLRNYRFFVDLASTFRPAKMGVKGFQGVGNLKKLEVFFKFFCDILNVERGLTTKAKSKFSRLGNKWV